MQPILWMKRRKRESEIMDDPVLDRQRHFAALRGLARLNNLSASASILWSPILQLARQCQGNRLRVLDVATGAGDLPLRLWRKARHTTVDLEVHGVDISPQALEFARKSAASAQAPITFSQLDVLQDALPGGYDVIISSLFFHHLSNDQAAELLRKMTHSAKHLVLINDLRRGMTGWLLAYTAARMLTTSDVVHFDAPASVRAAYTIDEMHSLAFRLGLDVTVARRWPFRFLMTWRRPDLHAPNLNQMNSGSAAGR